MQLISNLDSDWSVSVILVSDWSVSIMQLMSNLAGEVQSYKACTLHYDTLLFNIRETVSTDNLQARIDI